MGLVEKLAARWAGVDTPFLVSDLRQLRFTDILSQFVDLSAVRAGDVVALIGDFDPISISTLLRLIDLGAIVAPLSKATAPDHPYFFETARVDVVISNGEVQRLPTPEKHPLIEQLRGTHNPGLILFSTGTTGRPKAILHDMSQFLARFETPRPTLRTLNFLMFDHIGGINTLLHTMFNRGVVIAARERSVSSILETCARYDVELLPTTPTFLRMMLMSGLIEERWPECLRIVTYGTERMDQPTLAELCRLLPSVDFRQTFGMSELGIVRVKSESRTSLFMQIGGEGVETRVVDGILQIRSSSRMVGYLNAPSPFDPEGWYNTNDVVETKGEKLFKIVGRTTDVINVGGLKFMASEVERVALTFPGVALVTAYARQNPITGQHLEMKVQPAAGVLFKKEELMAFLGKQLQPHMVPRRIRIEDVVVGHRFKKS